MAGARAASSASWSAAIPPWSASFTTRAPSTAARHTRGRPFDERMTQPILIPGARNCPPRAQATPHRVLGTRSRCAAHAHDDLEGLVVDVEITGWPTPTRPPIGRVIEVLGAPGRLRRRRRDDDPQAPAAAHLPRQRAGRGPRRRPSRPGRSCPPRAISAVCPSSPSTAKRRATSTTPFWSPNAPTAATNCRCISPTWPIRARRHRPRP